jgi:tryptophan 7-halogenase
MSGIKSIIIFGNIESACSIAAGLASQFPSNILRISIVESASQDQSVPASACALSPDAFGYLQALGLEEVAFMRSTEATFKLSSTFQMRHRQFAIAYGNYGAPLGSVDFHHYALKYGAGAQPGGYDQYSLAAVMSRLGKFRHPEENAQSLFSTVDYGWHIDTKKYTALVGAYCVDKGVEFIAADLTEANFTIVMSDGDQKEVEKEIKKIVVNGNQSLVADLYIDCRDNEYSQQKNMSDAENPLEFNRILSCSRIVGAEQNVPACTAVIQTPYGFIQQIPLQNRIHIDYSYKSAELSDEQALHIVSTILKTNAFSDIYYRHINYNTAQNFWCGNCILMGARAHWLDALAVSSLEQTQRATLRLNLLFPSSKSFNASRDEYNRLTHIEYSGIRDFTCALYLLNSQLNAPLNAPLDSDEKNGLQKFAHLQGSLLNHRITLFNTSGQLAAIDLDPMPPSMWAALLIGSGLMPKRFPVIAQNDDKQQIQSAIKEIEKMIMNAAMQAANHKDYLKRYGVWSEFTH